MHNLGLFISVQYSIDHQADPLENIIDRQCHNSVFSVFSLVLAIVLGII